MIFGKDSTVFKRSKKGKEIQKKTENKWSKIKFGSTSVEISKKIIIGRDPSCKIRFAEDTMISRKHAEIEQIDQHIYLKDLGSTNGTYVNKQPIQPKKRVKLKSGDIVYLGSQRLKIT